MKISDILTSSDVIVIDDAVSKKRLLQEMSRKLAEDTGIDERTMFDIVVAEGENSDLRVLAEAPPCPTAEFPV